MGTQAKIVDNTERAINTKLLQVSYDRSMLRCMFRVHGYAGLMLSSRIQLTFARLWGEGRAL